MTLGIYMHAIISLEVLNQFKFLAFSVHKDKKSKSTKFFSFLVFVGNVFVTILRKILALSVLYPKRLVIIELRTIAYIAYIGLVSQLTCD